MPELTDHQLLSEFARSESEPAFAALVGRYVNLVYSTALRFTGNPHHAEEITQAVFIILARKAGKISSRVVLSGWLYQTARLTAANFVKGEVRRQRREQEAYMQSTLNDPGSATWQQIAPLLDDVMGSLNETDRNAVVLRFFENKTAAQVAAALNVSEAAAHKRTTRSLEKLRKLFSKRGVSSTTTVIAEKISTHSVQIAPVALAKTVTAVSIAKGTAASGSTLALVKGGLKIMAWTKMKIAVLAGAGALLAVAGGTAIYEVNWNSEKATGGPADMQIKWLLGKKYALHLDLVQSSQTQSPSQAQPAKEGFNWAQDITISALYDLPDGGRHLELEFVREAMNVSRNGRSVGSFDSTRSSAMDARNRLAIFGAVIGKRLEYSIDADGKVQTVEGADKLAAHIAAIGTPEQREVFNGAFGGDAFKNYLVIGELMPNRMINVGESWSVTKDVTDDPIGILTAKLKFTFKNWEQHGGRRCAHIENTGTLSSKTVSTASGTAVEIKKGTFSGELWFDPELGMVVANNEDEDLTLKITIRTQTLTKHTHDNAQMTLVDVQ